VGFSALLTRSGEPSGGDRSAPPSLAGGSGSSAGPGHASAPPSGAGAAPTGPPGHPGPLRGGGDRPWHPGRRREARPPPRTAARVGTIGGTVFTAGDNAYPNGTAQQFTDCYGPTWGRHVARTKPAAGNHDWETKDLAGYLGYFGTVAHPDGTSWYSYDLGAW